MLFNKKFFCGGFASAQFAIALPLLIFLGFGLASVGAKIFELGKNQLADYVLEEEVHDVLSRIIYDARAAKIIEAYKDSSELKFIYRTINEIKKNKKEGDVINVKSGSYDETRVYLVSNGKIHYKRQTDNATNPMTGDNYFGETEVTDFKFYSDDEFKNVLHVSLELKSKITGRKIKMSTAIFAPGCEELKTS